MILEFFIIFFAKLIKVILTIAKVFIIYTPRKRKEEIIKNINDETENALIIVSDIKSVIGGFTIGE